MVKPEIDDRLFDINQYGVLKIPTVLLLGLVIQIRHWILLLLVIASSLVGASEASKQGMHALSPIALFLELPTLLLLISAILRHPDGPNWARFLWRNGANLMVATSISGIAWLAYWLYQSDSWERWPELYFASTCLMDAAIALWSKTSTITRSVFSEFPDKKQIELN